MRHDKLAHAAAPKICAGAYVRENHYRFSVIDAECDRLLSHHTLNDDSKWLKRISNVLVISVGPRWRFLA